MLPTQQSINPCDRFAFPRSCGRGWLGGPIPACQVGGRPRPTPPRPAPPRPAPPRPPASSVGCRWPPRLQSPCSMQAGSQGARVLRLLFSDAMRRARARGLHAFRAVRAGCVVCLPSLRVGSGRGVSWRGGACGVESNLVRPSSDTITTSSAHPPTPRNLHLMQVARHGKTRKGRSAWSCWRSSSRGTASSCPR